MDNISLYFSQTVSRACWEMRLFQINETSHYSNYQAILQMIGYFVI